jgi:protein involved in polysaccharide export with SLBB domain
MLLALALLAWAGWVAPVLAQTSAQSVPPGAAPTDSFRISRGDELDLRFFYTPELNTRALVRSDGRISLHLVGEIVVEGQTIAELGATIERLLAPQVKRAQVSINVSSPVTQRVFVGGEVVRPGVQPLTGPMTALQAVMVAEGIKDTGQPSMAVVLRRLPSGERQALPVDLHRLMKGQDTRGDVVLQAFDVVVVPRAGIADVGRWVDLYIRRVLPISFGVSYTVDRNGSVAR